jgi:hypothetical protein
MKINMTIAIEENDTLVDLVRELDKFDDEGWTLDQIDIYRAAKAVLPTPALGVTKIYNETHLSHDGGLRP